MHKVGELMSVYISFLVKIVYDKLVKFSDLFGFADCTPMWT